uniref:7TM GPCR serpentine receptor class x (Srx) domain-containing protein n=1 Tax=Panagrolaimus sp. JU765 TaxID=591449 RepID=A0AC34Q328_9BILA
MSVLGQKIGHLGLFAYWICMYVQLFKSINRLVAIARPLTYRKYFSDKNSKYFILIVVALAGAQSIIYFFPGCGFYFDADSYIWSFDDTDCGEVISEYIDFGYGCTFMAVVVCIDGLTFIYIQKHRAALNKQQKKDIQFFMQAFATSLLLTSDPWIVFCSTSLAWELNHCFDGILMILFNSKLRRNTPVVSSNTTTSKEIMKTQSTKPTTMTRVN